MAEQILLHMIWRHPVQGKENRTREFLNSFTFWSTYFNELQVVQRAAFPQHVITKYSMAMEAIPWAFWPLKS